MDKFKKIIALLLVMTLSIPFSAKSAAAMAQTTGNILQNIPVFYAYNDYRSNGDKAPLNCVSWGTAVSMELASSPEGNNVLAASGEGGMMFPIHGWAAFSLREYYANGVITFDIRGEKGGEDFYIGLRSDLNGVEIDNTVLLSEMGVTVTTEWQSVEIPIRDICADGDGFSIDNINLVLLLVPEAHTFYLSEMYITSPDPEKQYPVIKVNQAGYEVFKEKYALVSCFEGLYVLDEETEFNVLDEDGNPVFTGTLTAVAPVLDKVSGEVVYKADFSSLTVPGEYRLSLPGTGIADSFRFSIAENVYEPLLNDLLKYFYYQRQGIDLTENDAGLFARKNLHPDDDKTALLSQKDDAAAPPYDASKGWYDAGDFGKYISPAATSVFNLLFAYELFGDLFAGDQVSIPESGNGVPDILDEVKWELDFMLAMQDKETGGIYSLLPHSEPGVKRYVTDVYGDKTFVKSTAATADGAAAFAYAYLIYKDIPALADYAHQCLEAAIKAWDYLEANPETEWVDGAYTNNTNILPEKFWAAATLFRATGEEKYEAFVLSHYKNSEITRCFDAYSVTAFTVSDMSMPGYFMYALTPNPDEGLMEMFKNRFNTYRTTQLNYYKNNPWKIAIPDWAFFWGSSGPICLVPFTIYMGDLILGNDLSDANKLLTNAAHYMLGINPISFSFVSGSGENSVWHIYSEIFTRDGIEEIPPGYVAGGANQYNAGFFSKYPSKCYVDSGREWTTNEHTIYWNSAMILCLAGVMANQEVAVAVSASIVEGREANANEPDKPEATAVPETPVLAEKPAEIEPSSPNHLLYIGIGAGLLLLGGGTFYLFRRRKKRHG